MISLFLGTVEYKKEKVGCVCLVLANESTRLDQKVCKWTCSWDPLIDGGIFSFQQFVVDESGTYCHEHLLQFCNYWKEVVEVWTGRIGKWDQISDEYYCELKIVVDVVVGIECCPCDCESRCPCESLSDQ